MSALNMVYQLVLATLALACLGVASEPNCTELVKPLANHTSMLGKWIYHAGASDTEEAMADLMNYTSTWFNINHIYDSTPDQTVFVDKKNGKCQYVKANVTVVGDRLIMHIMEDNRLYTCDGQYLETCPDCLLWSETLTSPGLADTRYLSFFSRTGNVSLPHLEEFKQQAACLNYTLGFHFGSNTDLCPEEKEDE